MNAFISTFFCRFFTRSDLHGSGIVSKKYDEPGKDGSTELVLVLEI